MSARISEWLTRLRDGPLGFVTIAVMLVIVLPLATVLHYGLALSRLAWTTIRERT
jgi:hypothetical protein